LEIAKSSHHLVFPMTDTSCVGAARRQAALLGQQAGLDEADAGRVAIVATELGSNLVKHATGGRLLLAVHHQRSMGHDGEDKHDHTVEMLSIDDGPGIPQVARCLVDGYSTSGTPGTGLGAVRRLADDFDIYSSVPGGTVAVARVRSAKSPRTRGNFRIGAVAIAAPGEKVCGDGWVALVQDRQVSLLVVDGLGHGHHAAEAAGVAMATFERTAPGSLSRMLESLHGALRMTRGAAVFTAHADAAAGRIAHAGAGNVVGRVVSGLHDRSVISQHGTAGLQLHRPEEMHSDWPAHAAFVLHTDGIQTRWKADVITPLLSHDPVLMAAVLVRNFCRGRDDATVVVLRRTA
jgi:anti-sigma regulatory factor (Ser/Thr protein kinase)